MQKHALLIGIDAYADGNIRGLDCAEDDARHMAAFLREDCGFGRVLQLRGKRATFLETVQAVNELAASMAPDDLFLFFFSGHGYEHAHEGHLLLLHEAARQTLDEMPGGVLPVRRLKRQLRSLPCRRVAFLLDACRGGLDAPRAQSGPEPMGDVATRDAAALAGTEQGVEYRVICSCSPGEVAYEIPTLSTGEFTSAFTRVARRHLGEGLEVSLDQAFMEEVRSDLHAMLAQHGLGSRRQDPWLDGPVTPLVLAPGRAAVRPRQEQSPVPPPPVAMTGHLQVNVNVRGATVLLNGSEVGKASPGDPLNLTDLQPGELSVEVNAPGWVHQVKPVRIEKGNWAQEVFELKRTEILHLGTSQSGLANSSLTDVPKTPAPLLTSAAQVSGKVGDKSVRIRDVAKSWSKSWARFCAVLGAIGWGASGAMEGWQTSGFTGFVGGLLVGWIIGIPVSALNGAIYGGVLGALYGGIQRLRKR